MTPDRRSFLVAGGATVAGLMTNGAARADEAAAKAFIDDHVKRIRPLEIAGSRAWWDANISGKDEDFKKKEDAQNQIDAALAEKGPFEKVKALKKEKDAGTIKDPLLARQIDLLYLQYLEKQVNPELLKKLTAKANAVEQGFNVFRANVNGQEMSDSKVRDVLKKETESGLRKDVWEASKVVGAKVEQDLRELVSLRNQAAKELGFPNFHAMSLYLNEQDGKDLIALFDDLDRLTKEPFANAKAEIDAKLAQRYSVPVNELMPWHYMDPYFQESPAVFDADLDSPYKSADILALCRAFYAGIGLPIDRVLTRSDLYEKKGKSPHAFCTDIDREGDATCTRRRASPPTPSAPTSTARATSACWATSSPPSTGWARCSTSSATRSTARTMVTSHCRCPTSSGPSRTSSPPRAWRCSCRSSRSPGRGWRRWASKWPTARSSTSPRPRSSATNCSSSPAGAR
jgi:peptidyl-dipeptidase A